MNSQQKNRRQFIKHAASSTVVATAAIGTGVATGPWVLAKSKKIHQWRMVTTWPKNFPALGTGAARLAKRIEAMSDGRIQVKVFGAGELVPALRVFDTVKGGKAQLGHGAAYYWKGYHEATQFFAAVPFGLNAVEMNGWLHHGGGQKLWDEVYQSFGLVGFAAGNTGVQMGGWYKKKINSVADFKGLKIRMPGLGGEVLRGVGASVVTLSGGEIFQSLKTGAIDATEWVGPYNDLAFGLHKAAPFYYWPGWHEPGATLELLINRAAYQALPKDLQSIVRTAAEAANNDIYSEFSFRNAQALQTLVNKHQVEVHGFSNDTLATLAKTSRGILEDLAKKDPMTKKVYDSYRNFLKISIDYSKVSEQGYYQARAQAIS